MDFKYQGFRQVSLLKSAMTFCAAALLSTTTAGVANAQSLGLSTATVASTTSTAATISTAATTSTAAEAVDLSPDVQFRENGTLSEQLSMPIYEWQKPGVKPRGLVLAVHGLAMNGKSYNYLGRTLAEQGYLVVSTDLHGYGGYISGHHRFCNQSECKEKTNYEKSSEDLIRLARTLRERHPSLPLFGVGESMGGAMVIRLAATHPELVDGLILSAPAIKHHSFIDPYVVADCSMLVANPRRQLDLRPFVRRYASDDPRIVDEVLNDTLFRQSMSFYELLQASNTVRKTISFVPRISVDTPVLVIQGSADRCVRANAVMLLLSQLRSVDQTVKWFHERGHILIETAYIKSDTMDSVVGWLDAHVSNTVVQAKCRRSREILAGEQTDFDISSTEQTSPASLALAKKINMVGMAPVSAGGLPEVDLAAGEAISATGQ